VSKSVNENDGVCMYNKDLILHLFITNYNLC
jgi:hypothetical protein